MSEERGEVSGWVKPSWIQCPYCKPISPSVYNCVRQADHGGPHLTQPELDELEGQADRRRQRTANAPSESLGGSTPSPSAEVHGLREALRGVLDVVEGWVGPAAKEQALLVIGGIARGALADTTEKEGRP